MLGQEKEGIKSGGIVGAKLSEEKNKRARGISKFF